MRTVHHTRHRLVIESRPWFLAVTVWGMGIAGLWTALFGGIQNFAVQSVLLGLALTTLALAHWGFPYQRFTFDRRTAVFVRRIARITGAKTETLSLIDVDCAAAEADREENARMERIVLLTRRGRYPLEFGYYSSPRGPTVATINAWLRALPA